MSAITSMLVPLETLAGWPPAPNPNPLEVLGLLIGLPLVVVVIISVLIKRRSLSAAGRGSHDSYTDPTWVGAKAGVEEILGDDNAAGQAAIQGGPAVDKEAEQAKAAGDRGGASARW
jgi:hypothetical protein